MRLTPAEREGVNELVRRQLAALHSTGAGITAGSVVRGLIRRELLAQKIEGMIAMPTAPIQQSLFTATAPTSAPVVEAAPVVEVAPAASSSPIASATTTTRPKAKPSKAKGAKAAKLTPKPKTSKASPPKPSKPKAKPHRSRPRSVSR